MLKLLGLFCVVLCGAGCGFAASAALRRQVVFCDTLRLFLEELGILMRWNGDTLPVLLGDLADKQTYTPLTFLKNVIPQLEKGIVFSEAWKAAIQSMRRLPEELRRLLLSLGESLGTSDLEGQMKTLAQHQQQLSRICQSAAEQYHKKGKLYRSIGLLGGMSAALLLC